VASIGTVFNRFIPKFLGYGVMTRNAVSAWEYFQIPPKRVVEFGTQVECRSSLPFGPEQPSAGMIKTDLLAHGALEHRAAARPTVRS
jgi:hypothetical protein